MGRARGLSCPPALDCCRARPGGRHTKVQCDACDLEVLYSAATALADHVGAENRLSALPLFSDPKEEFPFSFVLCAACMVLCVLQRRALRLEPFAMSLRRRHSKARNLEFLRQFGKMLDASTLGSPVLRSALAALYGVCARMRSMNLAVPGISPIVFCERVGRAYIKAQPKFSVNGRGL